MAEDAGDRGTTGAVDVTIGRRRFRLRTDDPEGVERIAARVDEAVRAITPKGGDPDDPRVALLAALNVAGEDEDMRRSWCEQVTRLAERVKELGERVEAARARISGSGDGV